LVAREDVDDDDDNESEEEDADDEVDVEEEGCCRRGLVVVPCCCLWEDKVAKEDEYRPVGEASEPVATEYFVMIFFRANGKSFQWKALISFSMFLGFG
jgi:hypothetical protein